MIRRSLLIIAFAAVVAGCNGGSASPPPFFTGSTLPTPTPTPSPTPTPVLQHLYVGNDNPSAEINQYTLPIGLAGQTPNFTITAPGNVFGLGIDGTGNLGVSILSGPMVIFNAPLSGASAPAATFPNGTGGTEIAFTPAGDFWTGAYNAGARINMYTHPFSNASAPSSFVQNAGIGFPIGVMLDATQNLYVVNGGTGTGGNVFVFAPPYTGAPINTAIVAGTAYRKGALSATRLFATSVTPALGQVDVYNLPITAASVPAFSITNGINFPEDAAVDAAGNLYVGNTGNSTVAVYAPPFSAASAPAITLNVRTSGSANFAIFSIAVGK